MTNLLDSLQGVTQIVEETVVGHTRTHGMVTSILSVTENVLFSYIRLLSPDYYEIFNMIDSRLKFTHHQTMTLMGLYIKQKMAVKESSEYILQYMSQIGVSLQDALDHNSVDLLSLIQSYHGTVLALSQYTENTENRNKDFITSEISPLTMYSSIDYKSSCYNVIRTTLRELERVMTALNDTLSGQFTYNDVVALTSLEDECFGDFLTVASNVTDKLRHASMDRYQSQTQEVLGHLNSSDIRGLLDPIIQLQMDFEHLVYHYVRNDIGKLDLALKLQTLAKSMLNECEHVVNTASSDIVKPMESLVNNIKNSLGSDYEVYFDSIATLSPFIHNTVLYRITSNMRIWFRPIINIAGSSVTSKVSQSLEDVYQYVTIDEIPPRHSTKFAKEYIGAAFEQPLKMIRSTKKKLEHLRQEMSKTVSAMLEHIAIFIRQTEMDEDFVK